MAKEGAFIGLLAATVAAVLIATRTQAAPPTLARLHGQVTDQAHAPIGGVQVSLDGHVTMTNANGDYVVNALDPGDYTVEFTKSGYGPVTV
jgi:hypothetical protein